MTPATRTGIDLDLEASQRRVGAEELAILAPLYGVRVAWVLGIRDLERPG